MVDIADTDRIHTTKGIDGPGASAPAPAQAPTTTVVPLSTMEVCRTIQTALDNLGRALRCPLCLSTLAEDAVLISHCKHAFCRSCLERALRGSDPSQRPQQQQPNPPRCPVCHQSCHRRRSLQPDPLLPTLRNAYLKTLRHFGLTPIVHTPTVPLTQLPPPSVEDDHEEAGRNDNDDNDDDDDDKYNVGHNTNKDEVREPTLNDPNKRRAKGNPPNNNNKEEQPPSKRARVTKNLIQTRTSLDLAAVHRHCKLSKVFAQAMDNPVARRQHESVVQANERTLLQVTLQKQQQRKKQQEQLARQPQQHPPLKTTNAAPAVAATTATTTPTTTGSSQKKIKETRFKTTTTEHGHHITTDVPQSVSDPNKPLPIKTDATLDTTRLVCDLSPILPRTITVRGRGRKKPIHSVADQNDSFLLVSTSETIANHGNQTTPAVSSAPAPTVQTKKPKRQDLRVTTTMTTKASTTTLSDLDVDDAARRTNLITPANEISIVLSNNQTAVTPSAFGERERFAITTATEIAMAATTATTSSGSTVALIPTAMTKQGKGMVVGPKLITPTYQHLVTIQRTENTHKLATGVTNQGAITPTTPRDDEWGLMPMTARKKTTQRTFRSQPSVTPKNHPEQQQPQTSINIGSTTMQQEAILLKALTSTNGDIKTSKSVVDENVAPTSSSTSPRVEKSTETVHPLPVGSIIRVQSRTWPGINKPGGVAKIIAVHQNSVSNHCTAVSYDVRYILGGSEKRVDSVFVESFELGHSISQEHDRGGGHHSQGYRQRAAASLPKQLLRQLAMEGFDVAGRSSVVVTPTPRPIKPEVNIKKEKPTIPVGGNSRIQTTNATTVTTTSSDDGVTTPTTRVQPISEQRKKKRKILKPSVGDPTYTNPHKKLQKRTNDERSCGTSNPLGHQEESNSNCLPAISDNQIPSCSFKRQEMADELYERRINRALKGNVIHLVTSSLQESDHVILGELVKELKMQNVTMKISENVHPTRTTLLVTIMNASRPATCQVRTMKTMQATLHGIPIVGFDWIHACRNAQRFLIPESSMYVRSLPSKADAVDLTEHGVAYIAAGLLLHSNQQFLPLRDCAVYMESSLKPDTIRLLKQAGATILTHPSQLARKSANYSQVFAVGLKKTPPNLHVQSVPPSWVYDSVSSGRPLPASVYQT